MAEEKRKTTFWNFFDNLEGDKVVWMIALMLMLISIVAIFSSTSQLAMSQNTSRMAIVTEQIQISLLGLVLIVICYNIRSIGVFRIFSQFGYLVSIFFLLILATHKAVGPIKPIMVNSAWRIVQIGGFQLHVFEVVKVAMVMYLAWAVNAYRNDKYLLANLLAKKYPLWKKPLVKKITYIYIPIFTVCLGIMVGSLSSTLFIGGIMFVTILIGGISIKELVVPGLVAVGLLIGCVGINAASSKPSDQKPFPHLESAINRLSTDSTEKRMEIIRSAPRNSSDFQEALDKLKQPFSAKIAIHEGGLFGKGPGRSTQRYVVPIMFEDYMFSFIVEEYGLLGGILVIILYISLLARGSIIARNCDNHFAKTAVAGLVILITGQAMMHIMINCDMGPLTGQTLPLVSHGNSSFLMFSIAFGIILSISKMARRKIAREAAKAAPLVEHEEINDVESSLNDLDILDSELPVHDNDLPDYGIDDHNNE
ncbi:MAG: FtsW/RodA/SpoVE family cell cycle protein [Bacteroidales bacterium]|nr:FtsW/RodA/SpoVE family cell cycle protein [Bacteroidales bacterium]